MVVVGQELVQVDHTVAAELVVMDLEMLAFILPIRQIPTAIMEVRAGLVLLGLCGLLKN
jgi:hypothetical protein